MQKGAPDAEGTTSWPREGIRSLSRASFSIECPASIRASALPFTAQGALAVLPVNPCTAKAGSRQHANTWSAVADEVMRETMCMQSVKNTLQQAGKLTILGGRCRLLGLGYAGHEHVVPGAGRAKALRPERGRHRGRRRVLGELQLRLRAAEQDVRPREGPACKPTGLSNAWLETLTGYRIH